MALTSQLLASGSGWRAEDVVCTCGPHDRPFDEQHENACVAIVAGGSFRYRSTLGAAMLAPGAILLGNHRHSFECSHEHGVGDRCLSFHFAPAFLEGVAQAIAGVRQTAFTLPRLPPHPALLSLIAAGEAARDDGDTAALEEVGLRLAGAVYATQAGVKRTTSAPSCRDERRISTALRLIEARAEEPLSLSELASAAAMSPYHFLRTFRAVVGISPHQFVLHTRLRRAVARLQKTADSISEIAFAAGFGDLSTFNRRFARIMGASPSVFRARVAAWS